MIKYIFLLYLSMILPLHTAPYTNLGVNLVNDGAFVNIINETNRFQKATSFDENGYPESDFELVLMDHRPVQEWNNDIDDPEVYRVNYSGIYKCSFIGSADVTVWGSGSTIQNFVWNEQINQTFFDLVIPEPIEANHGIVVLTFSNTARSVEGPTNKGVTNLKVIRPGYDPNTTQIFTNEYVNLCKAANFACYRFYNIQNIWDGEPAYPEKKIWDNRKTPLDVSQLSMKNLNGKSDGWCWEYIIELANILKKDIWICIHISCDSNYVLQLAQMLKNELDPNINIYIENSNEVWSPTHMTHGPYNKAQADAYGITFDQNYARRTVEVSNLFAEVFGQEEINKRIRVILAGQHAYLGRHDLHLDYIKSTFGAPKNYIYALSTALYFGSTKASGSVEEINEGMIEDINEQINNSGNYTYRLNHINKATDWELTGGCTSYEGGPHLPAGGGKDNLANQINAHRTEAMKEVMKKNYAEAWFDIGGGLALQFTLSSGYNRYGCWGLTDDYTNPDRNFKMKAMRELIGEWEEPSIVDDNSIPIDIKIYPNPIIEKATIEFELDKPDFIQIEIYNLLGIRIKTLANEFMNQGKHQYSFSINNFPNGIINIKIRSSNTVKYHQCYFIK